MYREENIMRYQIINNKNNHVYFESNSFKEAKSFIHKIAKRKNSDILIIDTSIGAILYIKERKQ